MFLIKRYRALCRVLRYCNGISPNARHQTPKHHFLSYSGPFFICFSKMFISTASIVVKRARNTKNVRAMELDEILLTAAFVGSISCMVQG